MSNVLEMPALKEFHVGVQTTTMTDIKIMAVSKEDAEQKLRDASEGEKKLAIFPQAVLGHESEIVGILEGPLPPAPNGKPIVHRIPDQGDVAKAVETIGTAIANSEQAH